MQLMEYIKNLVVVAMTITLCGCVTESPSRLPSVATDITLFSEFPQQESFLHEKLHRYFNLECPNGSSMSVVTPLNLSEGAFDKTPTKANTQYKIVIGNNIFGNTIYYTNPRTEQLAQDIAAVLNDFLASYDLEFSHSINNVLPFNTHFLDHSSYLSTLANDPEESATTFKIGIDHSLPLQDKTQLVVNLVVYLAKTLGSECLHAIPNNSDLQFSMRDCQCPQDVEKGLKSYENRVDWMM